jgi:hypothetical protein
MQFINLVDDGGDNLEKRPHSTSFVFNELSMLFSVCVPNLITIGSSMANLWRCNEFQYGGGGHL